MAITVENQSVNIRDFLKRYQAWHHSNLLANPNKTSVVNSNGHRIPCFSDRNIEQINACRSSTVIIDCLNEGFRYHHVFDQYDKNKHYLLFTPWFDQTKFKLPIDYSPIWYSHLLFDLVDDYLDSASWYYHLDRTYQFDYPKPCLSTTIAGYRAEREPIKHILVEHLEKDNFIFRYNGQDFGRNINLIDAINTASPDFVDVPQAFETQFSHISNERHYIYWKLISMAAHNMSYFNLVLESDVYPDRFFMTEKTIKPLLIGQPFVIYSSHNFLKHLQNLGFDTFNTVWDESYDTEPDNLKRAEMVAELCIKLKDFDWAGNQDRLQAICAKNQMRIHNLSAVAYQEFTNFEATIQALCLDK